MVYFKIFVTVTFGLGWVVGGSGMIFGDFSQNFVERRGGGRWVECVTRHRIYGALLNLFKAN